MTCRVAVRSEGGLARTAAQAAADGSAFTEAKLNIEHNATNRDTGFQWVVDSEGLRRFDATGPSGKVLGLEASVGALGRLGITELFFETVEPENAKIPMREVLAQIPAGTYSS